jgi:hypothetical protein
MNFVLGTYVRAAMNRNLSAVGKAFPDRLNCWMTHRVHTQAAVASASWFEIMKMLGM